MDDSERLVRNLLGDSIALFEYYVAGATRHGWRKYISSEAGSGYPDARKLVEVAWREFQRKDIRLFVGKAVLQIGPDIYADFTSETTFDPRLCPPRTPDPSIGPPSYVQVFALPNLPVLDVIEFAKVGTNHVNTSRYHSFDEMWKGMNHLASLGGPEAVKALEQNKAQLRQSFERRTRGAEPWQSVRTYLSEVMTIVPFDIQFADEAGLHATFLKAVNPQQAKEIATRISEINCEAMELPVQDLGALGLPVPADPMHPDSPDYEAAMIKYIVEVGKFRMWWA